MTAPRGGSLEVASLPPSLGGARRGRYPLARAIARSIERRGQRLQPGLPGLRRYGWRAAWWRAGASCRGPPAPSRAPRPRERLRAPAVIEHLYAGPARPAPARVRSGAGRRADRSHYLVILNTVREFIGDDVDPGSAGAARGRDLRAPAADRRLPGTPRRAPARARLPRHSRGAPRLRSSAARPTRWPTSRCRSSSRPPDPTCYRRRRRLRRPTLRAPARADRASRASSSHGGHNTVSRRSSTGGRSPSPPLPTTSPTTPRVWWRAGRASYPLPRARAQPTSRRGPSRARRPGATRERRTRRPGDSAAGGRRTHSRARGAGAARPRTAAGSP